MIKFGLLAGFLNFIVGLGLNYVVNLAFPSIALEYQNEAIFRPWSDPLMMVYFLYPFILGVVLAYLWMFIQNRLEGDATLEAFEFAKFYFIVATLPGMFVTYTSFQLSLIMVLLWAAFGFVQVYIAGFIFAKFIK